MFCKICQNLLDITNNVSTPNLYIIEDIIEVNTDKKTDIITSDYDVVSDINTSKKKKTYTITDEDIDIILNGQDLAIELNNFNIQDLNKIPYFNKLDSNKKTLVINRLYEKIPKNQKMPKNNEKINHKDSYFYCKKCGYNEIIPPKTFIFSRNKDKNNNQISNSKISNYKYDNTLPFSKNFNCINKDCTTHKEPEKKKAVFYRIPDSYIVRYICTSCDSNWITSINK